jgi:RES domain-containing protein
LTITAWRIVQTAFVARAFDGEGARRFGGRWNRKGTAVVYTAGSQALAVLEMLVHLKPTDLVRTYKIIPIRFAEALVTRMDTAALPKLWRRSPSPRTVQEIGDNWVSSAASLVMQVPSAIVPGESNYLLNVRHPDFPKLVIGRPLPYRYDPRFR